jgi:hypothetical protein
MATWSAAYEATPAATDKASEGDDRIREVKTDIRSRIGNEHGTYANLAVGATGVATADWFHKTGSALAYYQAAAPTQRPDASTTLGANDVGRLWIDSDDQTLYHWDGSAWEDKWRFADVVTFAADLVVPGIDSSNTGGISMEVDYRDTAGTEGQLTLYQKIIEIGDWNLTTTSAVLITHNLTLSKIVAVTAMIRSDDGSAHYPANGRADAGATLSIQTNYVSSTQIRLERGGLTGTSFDATSYNRGWITIWYTA